MAGVRDRELVSAGPWPLGIDNVAKEDKLPTDENGGRMAVRELDNMDLDAAGWPRTRPGQEQVFEGEQSHGLWSAPGLRFGLFVDRGELHAMGIDERVRSLGVPMSTLPVSYELINDRIYFSNRTRCGMLTLDQEAHSWAPDHPAGQPTLSAVDGYSLDGGQYQVAVTFIDTLGRESGTPAAEALTLTSGQGLQLAHIPQPADPDVTPLVNVYCSQPNDSVLRLALTIPAGITTGVIGSAPRGRTLAASMQLLQRMPPGHIVRQFRGRLMVAVGREILYSEPLRYGMFHPLRNRQRFVETVDLMEPVGNDGYFVAAGYRTFYLSGGDTTDLADMRARPVRSVGAVPGSVRVAGNLLGFETTEDLPVWLDTKGNFCVGLTGGAIKVLKDGEAVTDGAERAALLFREGDGLQQVIAALTGRKKQGLAVSDKPVVHVLYDGSAG